MAQTTAALASPLELIVRSGNVYNASEPGDTAKLKKSNIPQVLTAITNLPSPVNLIPVRCLPLGKMAISCAVFDI